MEPRLSYDIAAAIANASRISHDARRPAQAFRGEIRARLDALLQQRRVLCLPTTPFPAPLRDLTLKQAAGACNRIVDLTCIALVRGLPQVSLPLAECEGLPVGLSLIGWRGCDCALLALAARLGGA